MRSLVVKAGRKGKPASPSVVRVSTMKAVGCVSGRMEP